MKTTNNNTSPASTTKGGFFNNRSVFFDSQTGTSSPFFNNVIQTYSKDEPVIDRQNDNGADETSVNTPGHNVDHRDLGSAEELQPKEEEKEPNSKTEISRDHEIDDTSSGNKNSIPEPLMDSSMIQMNVSTSTTVKFAGKEYKSPKRILPPNYFAKKYGIFKEKLGEKIFQRLNYRISKAKFNLFQIRKFTTFLNLSEFQHQPADVKDYLVDVIFTTPGAVGPKLKSISKLLAHPFYQKFSSKIDVLRKGIPLGANVDYIKGLIVQLSKIQQDHKTGMQLRKVLETISNYVDGMAGGKLNKLSIKSVRRRKITKTAVVTIKSSVTNKSFKTLIGSNTRKFKRDAERLIASDPKHPLRFLLTANGKFRPTTKKGLTHDVFLDNPEYVQMGHLVSKKSGQKEVIVIMTAWENQFWNKTVEHSSKGGIIDLSETLLMDIGGVAVTKEAAIDWFNNGNIGINVLRNATQFTLDEL